MVKNILILLSILILTGCQDTPPKIEYRDKYIPVYVVPSSPKVERPELAVNTLTPTQKNDIGEWIPALTYSIIQLKTYACQLETIVNKYNELAKTSSTVTSTSTTPDVPVSTQLTVDFNKSCNIQ